MDRDKEEYVILVFFGYFLIILSNGIVCYTTVIHIFETTILFISAQLGGGLKNMWAFHPLHLGENPIWLSTFFQRGGSATTIHLSPGPWWRQSFAPWKRYMEIKKSFETHWLVFEQKCQFQENEKDHLPTKNDLLRCELCVFCLSFFFFWLCLDAPW